MQYSFQTPSATAFENHLKNWNYLLAFILFDWCWRIQNILQNKINPILFVNITYASQFQIHFTVHLLRIFVNPHFHQTFSNTYFIATKRTQYAYMFSPITHSKAHIHKTNWIKFSMLYIEQLHIWWRISRWVSNVYAHGVCVHGVVWPQTRNVEPLGIRVDLDVVSVSMATRPNNHLCSG